MAAAFLISFLVLLCKVRGLEANLAYWQEVLPKTIIPMPILSALSSVPFNTSATSWAETDEIIIQEYEGQGHCKVEDHHGGMSLFLKSRFVLPKNLRLGGQITLQLKPIVPITTIFPSGKDLPPFSSKEFFQNLQYFNISSNSKVAYAVNLTLHMCEQKKPMNGKWQYCATSLKDLLNFVNDTLGVKGLQVVSPPSASNQGLTRYRVASVKPLASQGKLIVCHRVGFPYAVFYCHQPAATTAFSVLLAKDRLDTTAICHEETTSWSPDYVILKALGVQPGTPICHFLHSQDLLWYLN